MSSEDVIHSFYIPAFRVKTDVVPGRYNALWFTATRPGSYHLFCAEYCGTKHSGMIGWVIGDGAGGLPGVARGRRRPTASPVAARRASCSRTWRAAPATSRTPAGPRPVARRTSSARPVELQTAATVVADEAYLRESIVNPQAKIVQGFQPIMPTFQGLVSEEQLLQLIAYVKSLRRGHARPDAGRNDAAGER